jgi:hypothetical protein
LLALQRLPHGAIEVAVALDHAPAVSQVTGIHIADAVYGAVGAAPALLTYEPLQYERLQRTQRPHDGVPEAIPT